MSKYEIYPGTLYDFTAGCYCGVLVKEGVMRRLASLQAKHLQDIKRVLSDEAERGNVFPSMWTLHYPDGKQTDVKFIDTGASVEQRIKSAVITNGPTAYKTVFVAGGMDEAKAMADAFYETTKDEQERSDGESERSRA